MSGSHHAKYKKIDVEIPGRTLTLYAGQKIRTALAEVTSDMTLYKGVRLGQVMKAVYEQGLKDGRKEVIEHLDEIKEATNYLLPGRPKK
jgi:hypothetical protein